MTNGYEMSNGMKVNFEGTVTPAKYATGSWYVEGVGDEIKLIAEQDVMIPGTYSTSRANPFDLKDLTVVLLVLPVLMQMHMITLYKIDQRQVEVHGQDIINGFIKVCLKILQQYLTNQQT